MSIAQDERAGLAADLSRLGPDAPTLCKGWTARDLLTHLLLRENDPLAVPGMAVNVFDAVTQARADRLEASGSFENLVARFAHGPGRFSVFRIPGLDSAANSMEYFIRHEDLLRAQPDWRPRELGHRTELRLADIIRKYGRALARRSPVGVRVEMTGQTDPVTLHPGDRIVTRNGGMVQLDGVTATRACHRAIRIGAGALGRNAPATELVLPQDQPVLLRGGLAQEFRGQDQALVPAMALLDLPGVEDEGSCELRLFRPVFDRPRIVYARGLELGFGPEAAAIRPAA